MPQFEGRDKPKTYASYPGGADLPDKLKVWCVQKSGKATYGVVSSLSPRTRPPIAKS